LPSTGPNHHNIIIHIQIKTKTILLRNHNQDIKSGTKTKGVVTLVMAVNNKGREKNPKGPEGPASGVTPSTKM